MGQSLIPAHDYKVACGRIAGRSHEASNTPCQDFVLVRRSASMGCIALADGAGSRARSEVGAEIVVRTVLRILSAEFATLYLLCLNDPGAARRSIHGRLLSALDKGASREGCSRKDLASTLLFVAHTSGKFIAGHIGDGVIAQIPEGGVPVTLSHPENGEYTNTTVFVTDPTAIAKFRLMHGECGQESTDFAVMSDGCAETLYERRTGTPAPALAKLASWNRSMARSKVDRILAANLRQTFSKKSGDDCSLALLSAIRVTERSGARART